MESTRFLKVKNIIQIQKWNKCFRQLKSHIHLKTPSIWGREILEHMLKLRELRELGAKWWSIILTIACFPGQIVMVNPIKFELGAKKVGGTEQYKLKWVVSIAFVTWNHLSLKIKNMSKSTKNHQIKCVQNLFMLFLKGW